MRALCCCKRKRMTRVSLHRKRVRHNTSASGACDSKQVSCMRNGKELLHCYVSPVADGMIRQRFQVLPANATVGRVRTCSRIPCTVAGKFTCEVAAGPLASGCPHSPTAHSGTHAFGLHWAICGRRTAVLKVRVQHEVVAQQERLASKCTTCYAWPGCYVCLTCWQHCDHVNCSAFHTSWNTQPGVDSWHTPCQLLEQEH